MSVSCRRGLFSSDDEEADRHDDDDFMCLVEIGSVKGVDGDSNNADAVRRVSKLEDVMVCITGIDSDEEDGLSQSNEEKFMNRLVELPSMKLNK